ncbi:MAG: HAD family hydrolase [Oscillospiraceae bacterium]|nr:HAD family hydrolase [Oscillospiraceae bacterium]
MKKAWFLDRDGTIIEDKHYLSDPDNIVILPRAAEAMRRAQEDGFMLVVVTNQSGIARGYFTEADADIVDKRLSEMLKEQGVTLAATYRCPHLPDGIPPYNISCTCRKPGTGMFSQAIEELGLDPSRCIACGDKARDTERLPEIGIPAENTGIIDPEHYKDLYEFYSAVKTASR